jgi:hypothetical protein
MTSTPRDPIHVLRIRLQDQPGAGAYYLARRSLIARLQRDADGSGDELADLGPDTGIARRLGRENIGRRDLIPIPGYPHVGDQP